MEIIANLAIPKNKFLNKKTSEIINESNDYDLKKMLNKIENEFEEVLVYIGNEYNKQVIKTYQDLKKVLATKFSNQRIRNFDFSIREFILMTYFSNPEVLKSLPIPISKDEISKKLEHIESRYQIKDIINSKNL